MEAFVGCVGGVETANATAVGQEQGARLSVEDVDEETLRDYLYDTTTPDPDLLIRTSGEQRLSNFLLWQSAYAEMVYQEKLFPDFDRRDLWAACVEYASRDRRFGGVK